jgi:hypothetical protein
VGTTEHQVLARRYYQLLSASLGTESALEYAPVTVERLLRFRSGKMDGREEPRRAVLT